MSLWAWDDFLVANGQLGSDRLVDVPPELLAPPVPGALPVRFGEHDYALSDLILQARKGVRSWGEIPDIEAGMRGLEATRKADFEEWLQAEKFDSVVFPATADVTPADADINEMSADIAWRNGVWVSNGNLVPRHLGIPTVTLPMGVMADTGMTPIVPPLPSDFIRRTHEGTRGDARIKIDDVRTSRETKGVRVTFTGHYESSGDPAVAVWIDGKEIRADSAGGRFSATAMCPAKAYSQEHSAWRSPYAPTVVALVPSVHGSGIDASWGPDDSPASRRRASDTQVLRPR